MKVSIKTNKEHNGVELYFEEKPEKKVLKALKEAKFRFHGKKLCWYKKEDDKQSAKKFAKNLQAKMRG